MGKKIEIVEVGPRDGFQNLKEYLPAEKKLEIIDSLVASGVEHMQITSFVHPKAIPQMRDAAQVAETCLKKYPDLDLFALIPNYKGAENARKVGMKKVTNVISLSVSHNKANINRTRDESFEGLEKIVKDFLQGHGSVPGCGHRFRAAPFEGKFMMWEPLLAFPETGFMTWGSVPSPCDTVGLADPKQVREFESLLKNSDSHFVHIHDTRGMGLNTPSGCRSWHRRCPIHPGRLRAALRTGSPATPLQKIWY